MSLQTEPKIIELGRGAGGTFAGMQIPPGG